MKIILSLVFIFILNFNSFGQTLKEIDSVSIELCQYFNTTSNIKNDSERINYFYQNKFDPFLLNNVPKDKIDLVARQLFYRIQRNCLDFTLLLERLYPPEKTVIRITEKPDTKLSSVEIKEFKDRESFKYLENNGDETKVLMKNNIWQDTFVDSTNSKLKYKWLNEHEFELEFIKSDNETRSAYSLHGDKFIYCVIDKKENYYIVSSKAENQNFYEMIKLYFD